MAVLSAAPDRQPPVKGPGGGTPPGKDETDLWMLVSEYDTKPRYGAAIMGMHPRRLEYLCHKWARQGRYDYGTVHDLGWPVTPPAPVLTPTAEQVEQVASWFDVDVELLTGDVRRMRPQTFVTPYAWVEPDLSEVHHVAAKGAAGIPTPTQQAVERVKAVMGPAVEAATADRPVIHFPRTIAELLAMAVDEHTAQPTPPRRSPAMQAFMDLPVPKAIRGGVQYPTAHFTVAEDGQITDHTAELARRVQRSNRG